MPAWVVPAAIIGAQVISSAVGMDQAKKARAQAKKLSKEDIARQNEADRKNLLAAAFGIGAPVRGGAGLGPGMTADPTLAGLGAGLSGAMKAYEFTKANPELFKSTQSDPYAGATDAERAALLNTEAGMSPQYSSPQYGSPYDTAPGFQHRGP
jgi:hypothetical protein